MKNKKIYRFNKKNILNYILNEKIVKNDNELKSEIKINFQNMTDEIFGIEFLNNNESIVNNISKIEFEILKELKEENNIFIVFYDKGNLKILNKELIIENINKNLFKYFKGRSKFSSQIHGIIFYYKKLIFEESILKLVFKVDETETTPHVFQKR